MFPRLKETLGTALDLVVEFSTLGEYRLDAAGVPAPASALVDPLEPAPRRGGTGRLAGVAVERIVAGGAAASRSPRAPAATPAARRTPSLPPLRGTPSVTRAHAAGTDACSGSRERGGRERTGAATKRSGTVAKARRVRSGAPVVAEQLCFADL